MGASQTTDWTAVCNESWNTKPKKLPVRPAKTQISLAVRPVYSLVRLEMAGSFVIYKAQIEDSDPPGRMHRLILVFAGCTAFDVLQLNYASVVPDDSRVV